MVKAFCHSDILRKLLLYSPKENKAFENVGHYTFLFSSNLNRTYFGKVQNLFFFQVQRKIIKFVCVFRYTQIQMSLNSNWHCFWRIFIGTLPQWATRNKTVVLCYLFIIIPYFCNWDPLLLNRIWSFWTITNKISRNIYLKFTNPLLIYFVIFYKK